MPTSNLGRRTFESILEEILTLRDEGKPVDVEAYVGRFPEHAADLRRYVEDSTLVDVAIDQEKRRLQSFGLGRWFPERSGTSQSDRSRTDNGLPRIGRFQILEEIGSGSQGVIYKAEQLGTQRIVALKIIRDGAFASSSERRRFENEVQLASQLHHPNIVSVYECGQDQGRDYFAMEYVEGAPLHVHLANRTLTVEETLRLFLQICDAVNYAHLHAVIHRDLKPSNIIVDADGRAHVLDFGLAKRLCGESDREYSTVTRAGSFAGTWHYASPEQINADPGGVDVRSDVYTLGVILFEMLTDTDPYPIDDASKDRVGSIIQHTPAMRPSSIRGDIDDDLDTIVLYTLRKDRERRYQSADALRADLVRYLAREAIEAKRDSPWYMLRMTLRHYRWYVVGLGSGVAVLVAFIVALGFLYADAQSSRATTEARAAMVRDGQRYMIEKLEDLHWMSNVVHELEQTTPEAPSLTRMHKPRIALPAATIEQLVSHAPDDLYDSLRHPGTAAYDVGVAHLQAYEDELRSIREMTKTHRFRFEVQLDQSDWMMSSMPMGQATALKLGDAFVASAWVHFERGQHYEAIADLAAARSISLDVADAPSLGHKSAALGIRKRTYDVLLRIFSTLCGEPRNAKPYIDWLTTDPPLPSYEYSVILLRMKVLQFAESAIRESRTGRGGFLDLDALDRIATGLYEELGLLTDDNRELARGISPSEIVSTIDHFIMKLEALTRGSHGASDDFAECPRGECSEEAWRFLRPLFPGMRTGMETRARADALRSGAFVVASLFRQRVRTGVWPSTLEELWSNESGTVPNDPYTGLGFGYRLVDGLPRLYSLNDDHTDNGGTPGAWGAPGTDFPLFEGCGRN